MKRYITIILIVISIVILFYIWLQYHKNPTNKVALHIVTVTSTPLISSLYYAGIIQPVKLATIVSPMDGVVNKILFHYGSIVLKNKILFFIDSEKLHYDYKNLLLQYIKTKSNYISKNNQTKESEFLYKNKLISKDDFFSQKTEFYNSRLELIEAKMALSHLLKNLDFSQVSFDNLEIKDIDKINKVLQSEQNLLRLKISSPITGVILQPMKSDSDDSELKMMLSGDQVKAGDVIAIIADPEYLMVRINVSELNINQLVLGQVVQITGEAFAKIILKGKIIKLNYQGESRQNGIPTFLVDILIEHLTTKQKAAVRIGMSAKVALNLSEGQKITIPIKAIFQKNDEFYVKKLNQITGKINEVAIIPGKTVINSVIVEKNISNGDKIVIAD